MSSKSNSNLSSIPKFMISKTYTIAIIPTKKNTQHSSKNQHLTLNNYHLNQTRMYFKSFNSRCKTVLIRLQIKSILIKMIFKRLLEKRQMGRLGRGMISRVLIKVYHQGLMNQIHRVQCSIRNPQVVIHVPPVRKTLTTYPSNKLKTISKIGIGFLLGIPMNAQLKLAKAFLSY